MPSLRGSLENLQPLIDVSVAAQDAPQDRRTYRALIDTGATRTCLTPRVIGALALPLRMRMLVASAQNAPERRRAYGFSFGLFCQTDTGLDVGTTLHVFAQEFIGPDFRDNDNFDVLIGMDLLCTGRLIMAGMRFEFTF